MRVAVMTAPGEVRVEDRPEPVIVEPTDAVVRLAATCVCGSDLWPYRGIEPLDGPRPMGHEYAGVVEEVGPAVTARQAGSVRGRLVLRLGQHLRDLPVRLPLPLRTPGVRGARRRPGRTDAGPTGRRHPGRHARSARRRPGAQPARRLRRAGHRLVRRRGRRGRSGQDGGRGRRRCGRPSRRPGRAAARRRTDHRDEPARAAAEARHGVRRHRHRHRTRRRRRRGDQGPHRRARRALGHRGRRHPGVDDAGHPLHPARRTRRLRRRHPRRHTARHARCSSPACTCTAAPPRCGISCPI